MTTTDDLLAGFTGQCPKQLAFDRVCGGGVDFDSAELLDAFNSLLMCRCDRCEL